MPTPKFAFPFLLTISASLAAALTPTTITVKSSANPSVYGSPVALTATVFPSAATGVVTFYSGFTLVETEPVINGHAVVTTQLLPSGPNSIKAYYGGDITYGPSTSATINQTVTPVAAHGFFAAVSYNTSCANPLAVAAGDFDRDGKVDLAVGCGYLLTGGQGVQIFLGNGDGTFQAALGTGYDPNNSVYSLAVADFNGDGVPDLVTTPSDIYSQQAVLLGNGDGTFQAPLFYSAQGYPTAVAVADFNNDGKADLALSYNGVEVLLGNGDGTFHAAVNLGGSGTSWSLAVADFNADGNADIAAVDDNLGIVSIYLGNGDGTFKSPVASYAGIGAMYAAAGDFNRDGKADLIISNGLSQCISVLMGNGDGTFQPQVVYPIGNAVAAVVVADLDGDGLADIAAATYSPFTPTNGIVSILLGKGDGTFQAPVNFGSGVAKGIPQSFSVADLNGDGRADLAMPNAGLGNALVFLAAGSITRAVLTSTPNPSPFGGPVTLTAQVSPTDATGTVTFRDGDTSLGSSTLNGGVAGLVVASLSTGTHSLTAFFGGDAHYVPADSQIVTQIVNPDPSSTQLASSVNPAVYGEQVILQATVSPTAATGTITFKNGSVVLGSATLAAGKARLATLSLSVGAHALTAVYGGDTNYITSTSPPLTETVVKTHAQVTLTSSPNPSNSGQSVKLSAFVLPATATGTVTFLSGKTVLGARTLSHGTATMPTSALTAGQHSLTALYSGDGNDQQGLSAPLIQKVN